VDVDPLNPCADEELVGLEAQCDDVGSITLFLTLPTVAARASARMQDPIMDFSKSIIMIMLLGASCSWTG
jgi:NhaP-type Na+/H+ or K+/H+ antiporter